jgi:parvulin-like peptidyl-prolyl isomerase
MSGRKYLALGLLCGLAGVTQGQQAPPPAAVVNGHVITQADLASVTRLEQSPVPIPAATQRQLKMRALAMMVDDLLFEQYLKAHGPQVPATEVDKKLGEMAADFAKEGKTLADFYRVTNQTEAQVKATIYRSLQWLAFAEPRVTEKEMRAHYTVYKDFYDGTTVGVSHIILLLDEKATEAQKAAARQKLTDLRTQILAGKVAFAEAAKAHSQCTLSAPKGGDLGVIPRKGVVHEAVARAAFALQANQISEIVETDYGMHLLLVTDRKNGQMPSEYEKVKDTVRQNCIIDLQQTILAMQRKASKIEINLP